MIRSIFKFLNSPFSLFFRLAMCGQAVKDSGYLVLLNSRENLDWLCENADVILNLLHIHVNITAK